MHAVLHATGKFAPLLALLLALVTVPATAAPPWKSSGSEAPGKGNSNKPPTIEGVPSTVAEVDRFYAFQPTASDKEGNRLVFSIKNKPSWAAFDTAHGYLSGYPALADAGTETKNIVISVSDGTNTASLPAFNLLVSAVAANLPPVISGSPATEVLAGQTYSFTPTALDPEGQPLVFKSANRPAWASFSTSSGKLYGKPGAADAGVYENIRISVSDGTTSTSLPAFSIAVVETTTGSVTLSWTAPTQNVDGTALLDLAGFRIYYGTGQGQYDRRLEISSPGITTAVIDNLTLGTWYFAASATTSSGLESALSAEVVRTVK